MNSLPIQWKPTRISLLGLVFLSLFGLFIYKIIVPEETEKISNTQQVITPDNVPLSQWKLVETQPLDPIKTESSETEIPLGQKYEYTNDQEQLKAEIRYSKYRGSFNQLIIIDLKLPAATISPDIHYQKGIGHYAFFEYDNATYLGSCINAKGEATVTLSQYNKNRYRYGWGITRTFLWLIGQKDLVEYRCLWTIMSIPEVAELDFKVNIDDNNRELNETEKKLEQAWLEWYSWWKKNFPDY
ncbi:MAG: cyanoexosortase A system-associated protein [Crocosphaera sp.]